MIRRRPPEYLPLILSADKMLPGETSVFSNRSEEKRAHQIQGISIMELRARLEFEDISYVSQ
jgi:hypothetical protein